VATSDPGPAGPDGGSGTADDGRPAGWRADWRALADLVLPRTCAGCGVPGSEVCPRCRRWLAVPRLATPRRHLRGFPPTVAAGPYAGPVRPVVVAFKEHGRAELARPLGTALALAVTVLLAGLADPGRRPVLLVPVPSSAAAVQRRGRDHVRELARSAAAELCAAGVPARSLPVLRRTRGTRDSAGLTATERRLNLAGRFRGRLPREGALPAGTIVLVDDVVTSGATLSEAGRALAALLAGAAPGGGEPPAEALPVVAAVVAATPRRRPEPLSGGRALTITVRS
jgi:predicted amidophosphoribosyltransferase